ncbi:MAG: hypothetical protein ACKOWF_13035 [Chloroflexota bacterium]
MFVGRHFVHRPALRAFPGSLLRALVAVAIVGIVGFGARAADAAELQGLGNHTLEVLLSFPDSGPAGEEQVCLGLYPAAASDFTLPPLQARCLDPGESSVLFQGISSGEFTVAVPGQGSRRLPARYQGQLVQTSIPDDPAITDYAIDVALDLAPDFAGIRGRVEVNVFGCPEGTNAGGDAAAWRGECTALGDGIPLSLSGVGVNAGTPLEATTGNPGQQSGKVEFTDLPAGAYELGGLLPSNVGAPTVVIQSSLDGVRSVTEGGGLALRPAESLSVDVYLVLAGDAAATEPRKIDLLAGFVEPSVTGGLTEDEAQALQETLNALP